MRQNDEEITAEVEALKRAFPCEKTPNGSEFG